MILDLAGQNLGQYQVVREIDRGGMSTIFLARQESMRRDVAIKLLPRSLTHDPNFIQRFYREVEVIAQLQHPHILPVYDFGEHDGMPYIVMAYLSGGTLTDLIRKGPMNLIDVGRIVRQIADALDYAHSKGIIHRDFKPGNVLLDERGNTYLADFGLAKIKDSEMTKSAILGTPTYMAPEYADPESLTASADIYALGVTIFQMLTGRVPYEAPTPLGVLMAHANKPIPDIREIRSDLPDSTQLIIAKSMAKSIHERFATPGNLADALANMLEATAHELRDTTEIVVDALMMTNMLGHVIFVDGSCLKLLKRHHNEARDIIGRPLYKVLGIPQETADRLIKEIGESGRVDDHRLEIQDSGGNSLSVQITAVATYDEDRNFVGVDINLRPDVTSPETLVAVDFDTVEEHLDSKEETFLQTYFKAQIEALIVLMVQWGGKQLGQKLEKIINETAQRNVWPVKVEKGQVFVELKNTDSDIYRALLAKAIDYTVSMIGERIVASEIQAVEEQLDPRILELITSLGIRDLFKDIL